MTQIRKKHASTLVVSCWPVCACTGAGRPSHGTAILFPVDIYSFTFKVIQPIVASPSLTFDCNRVPLFHNQLYTQMRHQPYYSHLTQLQHTSELIARHPIFSLPPYALCVGVNKILISKIVSICSDDGCRMKQQNTDRMRTMWRWRTIHSYILTKDSNNEEMLT